MGLVNVIKKRLADSPDTQQPAQVPAAV